MAYIDTKYLFKCETCRCMRSGKCTAFCDYGECYSPSLSKIPTADVVPKSEVAREVISEFKELVKQDLMSKGFYIVFAKNAIEHAEAELKKKYTEGGVEE